MNILLIEDQEKLAHNISEYLKTETYAVTVCHDGKDGFEKAMTQDFDLVILDINLPWMKRGGRSRFLGGGAPARLTLRKCGACF